VSQSRSRWLINIVLILAVVAFVGFSMAPLLNAAFKQSQTSPLASSASSQAPNVGETSKLEDQARGYELVLQREPENQTALQGLVQARIQLREPKGAIAPMEKLVALNPNQAEYKLLLAQLKQYDGDREGAVQVYRSILATKPGDIVALKGATGLLLQQNHPEAAISLLQDTVKTANQKNQTQPASVDVATVQLLLAQVYTTQKRYDEAIAVYDRVIEANKQDFRPVLAKAVVLQQEGKTEQAKPLFENAAALAPAQYKDEINRLATEKPVAETASPPPEKPVAETVSPTPTLKEQEAKAAEEQRNTPTTAPNSLPTDKQK